jgi:Mg-chelatase subunit ChlD
MRPAALRRLVVLAVVALGPLAWADDDVDPSRAAFGSLEARDVRGGSAAALLLKSVSVQVQRAGDVAETRVEHVFENPTSVQLEGTFRFPLPSEAILTGLAMEIDGQLVAGDLVEREQARQIYQQIVERMRDPAILEWDGGQTFQLRVFPIEPESDKRIVVRYLVPLAHEAGVWSYVYPTAGLRAALPRFTLEADGRTLVDAHDYRPQDDVVVKVAPQDVGVAFRETRAEGTYTAVRLQPDWSRIAVQAPRRERPQSLLLLVDVSRSMLESRRLTRDAVQALLAGLGSSDRFAVLTVDLDVRGQTTGFVPATTAAVKDAVARLDAVEPDGASDLGAGLRRAAAWAETEQASGTRDVQVIYLGDGTPTWGDTDAASLRTLATAGFTAAPLYALALGRNPNSKLLAELTRSTGGRALVPRATQDVRRFAKWLHLAPRLPRLREARVGNPGEGHTVFPREPQALYEGDEIVALVHTPAGQLPPESLVIEGETPAGHVSQTVTIAAPAETPHVAARWAVAEIERLEAAGAAKEEVVAVSRRFGVLSRYTAFLVLEAEERRRRFEAEPGEGDPTISGRDLESLADASLSADRIQPGDPEVRITAPADARAVTVMFPWGATKIARYEPALRAWTVRFLIDKTTPDGRYPVLVRVVHADARVEIVRIFYTVDTQAPTVDLTLLPAPGRRGVFELRATQIVSSAEAVAHGETRATIVPDVRRVEAQMPDGTIVILGLRQHGELRGTWTPRRAPTGPFSVRAVVVDRALNRSVFSVTLDPQNRAVAAR